MKTFKRALPAFLIAILLLTPTFQSAKAKDAEMEVWLTDTANPAIQNIVAEYNKTIQLNWDVNLSSYLIESDGQKTVEKLDSLRKDIKSLKKEAKNIKAPKSATKEDKKQIKTIKKNLTKTFNQTDKSTKKLIKRIEKDKKIKVIKPRKSEQKSLTKAIVAYEELNNSLSVKALSLELIEAVKIDQEVAEKIVHDYNEEQKAIAAKKAAEAEQKAKEEAEKKRLAEEKAAEEEAKRLAEEKKAEELARAEEETKKKAAAQTNETEWFQNCTELRKKYPNGVGSDHPAYQPKMDRDKDGWACER